ncbi:mycofactocin biosynthesis chaperone MftB [Citricoccus sp. SGAir0253]|uniref:mycofactocin biosynthesis chaperone MftB n=1 Tax=Citricoccus sp. SGAir0253 TaxID=2567881 RepID=UPI0010CD1154|nr:mycofactocin biosynthesis chaperone MftB [Citricoccus sp. SGAir0253]QCU78897.1 mycofactocin biosynthesis chaperone MftB [Citricoccus sp. SGAir0253]
MATATQDTAGLGSARLRLASSVSVRPEAFGALLYDFRTRKLMFLKTPRLAAVVDLMDGALTVDHCLDAGGAPPGERAALLAVLDHLLGIGMLRHAPTPKD